MKDPGACIRSTRIRAKREHACLSSFGRRGKDKRTSPKKELNEKKIILKKIASATAGNKKKINGIK